MKFSKRLMIVIVTSLVILLNIVADYLTSDNIFLTPPKNQKIFFSLEIQNLISHD